MKRHIHLKYIVQCWFAVGLINHAWAESLPEYTIKAAYLYNFSLLTEWPQEVSKGTFDICILGHDNFGSALDSLRGKAINNKPIQIHHILEPKEVNDCHLVFIGNMGRYRTSKLMSELANLPVLTITDETSLAEDGVMILLYPENQRLVFNINLSAAKQANLNLSARLLRLARQVTSP